MLDALHRWQPSFWAGVFCLVAMVPLAYHAWRGLWRGGW
jgi:hypothetical protein